MNRERLPWISDLKRNSTEDGPGIRTVVFFKGCPLVCPWCHNPETITASREILRDAESCLACGGCETTCPRGIARRAERAENRKGCDYCGRCEEACPAMARRIIGRSYAVDELVALLLRDADYFVGSGGGVTLSGGEPTVHMDYCGALAQRLMQHGVGVVLETCGHFDWDRFERILLPHLSTVYFDLKIFDEERHLRATGAGNRRILENFSRLSARDVPRLLARIPLIPGFTSDTENLRGIASFLASRGIDRASLLPYNPLFLGKFARIGRLPPAGLSPTWMDSQALEKAIGLFQETGIRIERPASC